MSENQETKMGTILAQWQTCVEMANSVSQRRDTMNNIFVTLNLAIIAALSIVLDFKSIFILIAGIAICILWFFSILNYKRLNSAKFDVINKLEEELPCNPFNQEWEILKNGKKYKEGTTLEKFLPIIFFLLYIASTIVIFKRYINDL